MIEALVAILIFTGALIATGETFISGTRLLAKAKTLSTDALDAQLAVQTVILEGDEELSRRAAGSGPRGASTDIEVSAVSLTGALAEGVKLPGDTEDVLKIRGWKVGGDRGIIVYRFQTPVSRYLSLNTWPR